MLDELRIRALGVIDDAVLPLGPGLTVVTGETGAGKTMVVTGLLLLFGGRADAARVRTGADQASVEGRLVLAADSPALVRAQDAGGQIDEADADRSELVLRRVVNAAGRSRAYVGGTAAPVAVLAELSEQLVAVHGQSDQLRLVRPSAQRAALDRYAGIDTADYERAYVRWRDAEATLTDRLSRTAELRREADLLQHGVQEIEQADPQPGELIELGRVAGRLGDADALTAAARQAHDALLGSSENSNDDTGDVSQLLAIAARSLGQLGGADPELDALASRLIELSALAADLGAEFGAYGEALDTDPARLEQVETRRAVLNALVRKYCDDPEPSLDAVLDWAAGARTRLGEIDVSDEAIEALRTDVRAAASEAARLGSDISVRRRAAAERLAAAVTTELAGLAMADARVAVAVRPRPVVAGSPVLQLDGVAVGAAPDGLDEVELLLRPHAGAPELPVAKGASGGELSRVMLALEVCLVGTDPVPTLVFDEVDAGVGGRAAVEVGRRLARLGRERQVLVVTHLPQVAAYADRHVVVDKPAGVRAGGVTASDVRVVTGDDRIGELARMLAGSDTPTAREHASELLAEAAAPAPRRRSGTRAASAAATRSS